MTIFYSQRHWWHTISQLSEQQTQQVGDDCGYCVFWPIKGWLACLSHWIFTVIEPKSQRILPVEDWNPFYQNNFISNFTIIIFDSIISRNKKKSLNRIKSKFYSITSIEFKNLMRLFWGIIYKLAVWKSDNFRLTVKFLEGKSENDKNEVICLCQKWQSKN